MKHNPKGDPFELHRPKNADEVFLRGLGLGLYWGEGTKSNRYSIRLGNTDPRLIKKFIEFLVGLYGAHRKKIRFGLQIFSDMDPEEARRFWSRTLGFSTDHFYKVIVTPSRNTGTYHRKVPHGVLTVYYNNKKLRDTICSAVDEL